MYSFVLKARQWTFGSGAYENLLKKTCTACGFNCAGGIEFGDGAVEVADVGGLWEAGGQGSKTAGKWEARSRCCLQKFIPDQMHGKV